MMYPYIMFTEMLNKVVLNKVQVELTVLGNKGKKRKLLAPLPVFIQW